MSSRSLIQYVEQEWGILPHFLIFAVLEWILILILFINGILSSAAALFAKFFGLPVPCSLCTRFDNIGFRYNESVCEAHKKEISHLAYCHVHKKLSDIRRMCEGCLLSFATEKESDCDTYKSLVGFLHKDLGTLIDDDNDHQLRSTKARRRIEDVTTTTSFSRIEVYQCSCCGSRLKAKLGHSKGTDCTVGADGKRKLGKQVISRIAKAPLSSPRTPFRQSVKEHPGSFQLPHIKYMELKLAPGNEFVDGDYSDNATISEKGDTTSATMPLLTEADKEDANETQTPTKGNKFVGIPLTDSASSTPKYTTNRSSSHKKTQFSWEPSIDENALLEDDIILHHLKRQVRLDRKSLIEMYMELDEERSASAVAANNAMAMITRLQAEKAAIQMEALQYQRMMEEQAEYDQENFQAVNELVAKRDDEIKALEAELEIYRERYGLIITDEDDDDEWPELHYDDLCTEKTSSITSSNSLNNEAAEDGESQ